MSGGGQKEPLAGEEPFSVDRARAIFGLSNVAMVISTPDGGFIDANPTFLELSGYSRAELRERGLGVIYSDSAHRSRLLDWLRRKGEVRDLEMQLIARSGERRWFSVSSRLTIEGGEERILSIAVDIDRRKRSEHELRASQQRLRTMMEQSPVAIQVLSRDGRIVEANAAFFGLWGTPRKLASELLARYNAREDAQLASLGFGPLLDRAFAGEAIGLTPMPYDPRQSLEALGLEGAVGGVRWVRGRIYPLRGDDGEVSNAVLELEDVTESETAREAPRESELKFRSVFERAGDAIGVSVGGVTVEANPAYLRLFGYASAAEIVGKPILDHVAPESRPKVEEYERRRARGEPSTDFYETRGLRTDGTTFDMEVRVGTYELNGTIHTIGLLRDVTERRRTERELAESEARYRALFEHSSDGILIAEVESREYLYANPAACRLLGYEEQELVGLRLSDIHPEDIAQEIDAVFDGKPRPEGGLWLEMPCRRKDGRVVYADVSASAIVLDGRLCAVAFLRDVTERRLLSELEEKTAELEAFNEAMIGRESRIIELKEEVNWLSRELGREPPYEAVWEATEGETPGGPRP